MNDAIKLLSKSTNYAVVQLPGRNFPGVVLQGDSLHSLLMQAEDIQKLATKHKDPDLSAEAANLYDLLSSISKHFETVCDREGVSLPYQRPKTT